MRGGAAHIALITGPAGVGKSTLSWDMGAQFAEASIAHAAVETDQLGRVFPRRAPRI